MVEQYLAHREAFEDGPVQYPILRDQFDKLISIG
jgi:hypothetical protein